MRSQDDLEYYRQRAKQEREIAEKSEDRSAASVHAALAEEYSRRGNAQRSARS